MTCVPALCTEPQPASAARFNSEVLMSAIVIQIRDFQSKRDLDRLYAQVTQELATIVPEAFSAFPSVNPDFSQANALHGDGKEPA